MLRGEVQTSGTDLKQRGKDNTKRIEQQLLSQEPQHRCLTMEQYLMVPNKTERKRLAHLEVLI